MDHEEDDTPMLDAPGSSFPPSALPSSREDLRSLPTFRASMTPSTPTRTIVQNGFRNPDLSSVPPSDDEPLITSTNPLKEFSREASVMTRDTNHLSLLESLPPSHELLDTYLSDLESEQHDAPAPFLSELPTGYCYDVRMRYHCELEPPKDRRDYHPEDPRRIFSIYRELCVAGLIDDRLLSQSTGAVPLVSKPLKQIDVREVKESEVELVHDKKHWDMMKATTRKSMASS